MKETLLQNWDTWPTVKSCKPLPSSDGVIDENAFNTIEVDKVFDSVNYAATTMGQAVLFRSLAR
ncbi:MAG: MutS-related protein, partial [Methylococcaceae bacterium]